MENETNLSTNTRRVRELPPLSPAKKSNRNSSSQKRRKKRNFESVPNEKLDASDRGSSFEKENEEYPVHSQSPIPRKPALPPRRNRKPSTDASKSISSLNEQNQSPDNVQDNVEKPRRSMSIEEAPSRKSSKQSSTFGSLSSDMNRSQNLTAMSKETLEFELTDLEEDVTELSNDTVPVLSVNMLEPMPSQSQHVNYCFIEQKDSFKTMDKNAWMKSIQKSDLDNTTEVDPQKMMSALKLAQSYHKVFRTFALFCHGLLAGISLWQIIMIYELSSDRYSLTDFLEHYAHMAQPVQSVFSCLLAVCTVSVFDRYEFGRLNMRLLKDIFTLREGAFAVLIYFLTLILNSSINDIDDQISLYQNNSTIWLKTNSDLDPEADIEKWRTMNLCRCLGAIIGWIFISIYPNVDLLSTTLACLAKEQCRETRKNVVTVS